MILKSEEALEEYKILAALTELIYDNLKEININIEVIAEYDMIFSKAKYSRDIDGIKPKLNDYGYINIAKGKHPLLKDAILEKAKKYAQDKDYNLELVKESKVKKKKDEEDILSIKTYTYKVGDKVFLIEHNDFAIVYKPIDNFNNITVLYKDDFLEVNEKRLRLELEATDLYPEDYDLNTLFVDFQQRKLERDIERGSKKALKKIQKEIRNNNN